MIPTLLLYKIMQLFAVMILGFVIVKARIVKSEDAMILSKISLYLLMPATILSAFDIELTSEVTGGLLLAFGVALALHLVFLVIDLIYRRLFGKNGTERASIMYSNAGNLIIPIVSFVLGEEWVIYSCGFLIVQLVFLWTHGVRLFSAEEKFNLKKILLNVNLITIVIGAVLLLCGIRLPKFAAEISSSLGGMLGNVGMLIAGMTMAGVDFGRIFKNRRLYLVVLMRVIVMPLIALVLLRLTALWVPVAGARDVLLISFLACATPSAATVMQLAQLHQSDADLAVSVNVVSTLASIATMPLFVWLYCL